MPAVSPQIQPVAPNLFWSGAFTSMSAQGAAPTVAGPESPTYRYYAFLSKADYNTTAAAWDLLFEAVSWEWMQNTVLASGESIAAPVPVSPALLYVVTGVTEPVLVTALGLTNIGSLAEGSWYLLTLTSVANPPPTNPPKTTGITGDFFGANLDTPGSGAAALGNYALCASQTQQLLAIPAIVDGAVTLTDAPGSGVIVAAQLAAAFTPTGNTFKAIAPTGPPTPIAAVAVMDVGEGNCSVITTTSDGKTLQAAAYYDIGYPIYINTNTLPAGLQTGGSYLGPITPAMAPNCPVFISHWDWDHWRLGAVANLVAFNWIAPVQPFGPAAANFWYSIAPANRFLFQAPAAAFQEAASAPPIFEVYQCQPPMGIAMAEIMDNSGLAIALLTSSLPVNAGDTGNLHAIVLTADARFDAVSLPAYIANNITAIVAASHGSDTADVNAPPPINVAGNTNGRIAYSYGIVGTNHVHGYPDSDAVQAYTALGWTSQMSTAEGAAINSGGSEKRGNILIGQQLVFDSAYAATAFFSTPNQLT